MALAEAKAQRQADRWKRKVIEVKCAGVPGANGCYTLHHDNVFLQADDSRDFSLQLIQYELQTDGEKAVYSDGCHLLTLESQARRSWPRLRTVWQIRDHNDVPIYQHTNGLGSDPCGSWEVCSGQEVRAPAPSIALVDKELWEKSQRELRQAKAKLEQDAEYRERALRTKRLFDREAAERKERERLEEERRLADEEARLEREAQRIRHAHHRRSSLEAKAIEESNPALFVQALETEFDKTSLCVASAISAQVNKAIVSSAYNDAIPIWLVVSAPEFNKDGKSIRAELEALQERFPFVVLAYDFPGSHLCRKAEATKWHKVAVLGNAWASRHFPEHDPDFRAMRRLVYSTFWFQVYAGVVRRQLRAVAGLDGLLKKLFAHKERRLRLTIRCLVVQGGPVSRCEDFAMPLVIDDALVDLTELGLGSADITLVHCFDLEMWRASLEAGANVAGKPLDMDRVTRLRREMDEVIEANEAHENGAVPRKHHMAFVRQFQHSRASSEGLWRVNAELRQHLQLQRAGTPPEPDPSELRLVSPAPAWGSRPSSSNRAKRRTSVPSQGCSAGAASATAGGPCGGTVGGTLAHSSSAPELVRPRRKLQHASFLAT